MCTHSWIFLDFYRLQSSNCFFALRVVDAAGRGSAKAAEAGGDGRGWHRDTPEAASLSDAPRVALSHPCRPEASVPEASLATKRK